MAPPVILAAAGAVQAVGAIRSANAQADAQENNARLADSEAAQTREQAAEQERRYRALAQKRLGSIRALYGASGLTMDGSPTDVLQESMANAEMEALDYRKAGENRAKSLESEANSSRKSAKQTRTAGYVSAAAGLLSAGARVPEMFQSGGRVTSDDASIGRKGARLGRKVNRG